MHLRDCQQTDRLDVILLGGHVKQGTGEQNGERVEPVMTGGHMTVNS